MKSMKIIRFNIILIFAIFSQAFTRAPFTEVKFGYQDLADAEAGYILGFNIGKMIDESLSWSIEFNYYQKNYKKITDIDDIELPGGLTPSQKQLEIEYTTHLLPLFIKINYENAIGYKSPFYVRASAGLGWEMLWNKVDNYLTDTHDTRFYHGFGWQASLGVGIAISSKANLFFDGIYNGSKVKRNKTTSEEGLPIWEELDISGFGLRIGVSIVGFGW